jgi:hypothetical protein
VATVFLSYTQDDPPHQVRVGQLAARLRGDLAAHGVEVVSDHTYPPGGPDDGWDVWSEKQAERSEIVLPVFNTTYLKCWHGEQPPGIRAGATAEAQIIRRRVYESGGPVRFARVVVLDRSDRDYIPARIRGLECLHGEEDYARLLAWIQRALGRTPVVAAAAHAGWPDSPPALDWRMADQTTARDAFSELLTVGTTRRILLLHGPTEHGKTHLTRHLHEYALGLRWLACGRFDCKGTAGIDGEFDSFLPHLDISLDTGLALDGPKRFAAILAALAQRAHPTLLVFDTYEVIGAAERWIEDQLLPTTIRAEWLRVVIAGQRVPDRTRGGWDAIAFPTISVPKPSPDDWHIFGLAHDPALQRHFVEQIYTKVDGSVSLLASVLGRAPSP